MKLYYLGHSSFLIESKKGIRIVIDPYHLKVNKKFPEVSAEVVLITHEHPDHNGYWLIKPFKIEDKEIQSKTLKRTTNFVSFFEIKTTTNDIIEFTAVPSFHDKLEGKKLGPNTIWTFYIDGIKITHVGDLGHLLKDQDLKIIGTTDILIAPIGGGDYTINFKEFLILMDQLKSIVSIPVHYKTKYTPWISDSLDIVDFPAIEKLDDYILNLFTIPPIPKIYLFPEEVWDKIPEKIS